MERALAKARDAGRPDLADRIGRTLGAVRAASGYDTMTATRGPHARSNQGRGAGAGKGRMKHVIHAVAVAAALLTLGAAAGAQTQVAGFRHDGAGYYRDASPPVAWNEEAGEGIAWKIALPTWGNSEAIIIGERVYLLRELDWWNDERVAPSLVCLRLADGSVVWERELDHLDQFPPDVAARARDVLVAQRFLRPEKTN